MSATDRIREQAAHVRRCEHDPVALKAVLLTADDAEALCDLADAAREGHTCGSTGPWRCPVCAALARLDEGGKQ